jgi:hypothetical protein
MSWSRLLRRFALCLGVVLLASTALGAYVFTRFRPPAMTIGQRVFLFQEPEEFRDWTLLYVHEETHKHQFRTHGFTRFMQAYLFDPEQRLRWEVESRHAEMCYLRLAVPEGGPDISWEREAKRLTGYVPFGRLSADSARAFLERDLSRDFCERLLARVGFPPLPPEDFPVDEVLHALLPSGEVQAKHVLPRIERDREAGRFAVPADRAVGEATAEAAWALLNRFVAPPQPEELFPFGLPEWPTSLLPLLGQAGFSPLQTEVAGGALDSREVEALRILARAPRAPGIWTDSVSAPLQEARTESLVALAAAWHGRIAVALVEGRVEDADTAARELIGLGQRLSGESLQEHGRALGRRVAAQGMEALAQVRGLTGDTGGAAAVRTAMNPPPSPELGMELLGAATGRDFLAALLALLERRDLAPSLKWDLLFVAQVLVRCGHPTTTGVADHATWRRGVDGRVLQVAGDARILQQIRAWPHDDWHCAGLADQYARGWRRPMKDPPIRVSWAVR